MPQDPKLPLSIAARLRLQQADAALNQMYGYFSRHDDNDDDDAPRAAVSDLDARTAA